MEMGEWPWLLGYMEVVTAESGEMVVAMEDRGLGYVRGEKKRD